MKKVELDRLTIVIDLGNESMRTQDDVAWLLRQMAASMENQAHYCDLIGRKFRDMDGNTVAQVFGSVAGVPSPR